MERETTGQRRGAAEKGEFKNVDGEVSRPKLERAKFFPTLARDVRRIARRMATHAVHEAVRVLVGAGKLAIDHQQHFVALTQEMQGSLGASLLLLK